MILSCGGEDSATQLGHKLAAWPAAGAPQEPWRLFDRSTSSGLSLEPGQSLSLELPEGQELSVVQLFGASGGAVRVSADDRDFELSIGGS